MPYYTAGIPEGGLPVPTCDEHWQAESSRMPCPSAHRTKEKGQCPKRVANADQDTSPSIKSRLDQHGTWVTVCIVLRQANQENISATRMEGERRTDQSFRASARIYTAMDTELSPASQTRASTATCSRGLIDNTKDRLGQEPKERAGLSNDGEMHSTVYRTPTRYHRPHCLWDPPPVTTRP